MNPGQIKLGEGGMVRTWITFSGFFGFLAVAMGAAGAHALKDRLSTTDIERIETAVSYQMWHALALIGVAWLASKGSQYPPWTIAAAGWSFVVGITLFSGSLYGLSLTGMRIFAHIAPVGGLLLMAGWLAVLASAFRIS